MRVSVSWRLPEEFLLVHKAAGLAPRPVVGLVLQAGALRATSQNIFTFDQSFAKLQSGLTGLGYIYLILDAQSAEKTISR